MTVCCQNLTLGALSNHSTLSVLDGALFKKFGLFLNMPHILHTHSTKGKLLQIVKIKNKVLHRKHYAR